jgi:hypothetical protein
MLSGYTLRTFLQKTQLRLAGVGKGMLACRFVKSPVKERAGKEPLGVVVVGKIFDNLPSQPPKVNEPQNRPFTNFRKDFCKLRPANLVEEQ